MKKLNLEKLKLAAEDVLQRSQMTGIYGGSGGSSCSVCYLFDADLNLLETLSSSGPCDAEEICNNYPGCRFQDCY
jgi:hypothetical protein